MASVTPRPWPIFLPQMEGHGVISSMNGRAFESNGLVGASNGSCAIGVMAKTPRPGFSKTRLCPPLCPEQAAVLSAAFLRDTTTNIAQAALSVPVAGYAAYAPSGTEEALISHVAKGTVCVLADGSVPIPQGVEGFGRCLLHATQQMFAAGHTATCVPEFRHPDAPNPVSRDRGQRSPRWRPSTCGVGSLR